MIADRYEIEDACPGVVGVKLGANTWYLDDEQPEAGAIRQQARDIESLRAELAAALDLLDTIFAAYENGPPCYQDPDEISGYLGNAVLIDDDTFHRTARLLNQNMPRKDGE